MDVVAVEINGQQTLIRQSLANALAFSPLEAGEYIWADAICINQNDVPEKDYQLGLIAQIYERAVFTFAWLGLPDENTSLAAKYLGSCSKAAQNEARDFLITPGISETVGQSHTLEYKSGASEQLKACATFVFQGEMGGLSTALALGGLYDLLSRSYWERMWIIQEIAKSNRVMISYGEHRFDLEMILLASTFFDEVPKRTRCLLEAIGRFRLHETSRRSSGSGISLLRALFITRFSLATDPRNRIFALLGLASDSNTLVPLPSYADSVQDVYHDLTVNILQSPQRSDIAFLLQPPGWREAGAMTVQWDNLRHLPSRLFSHGRTEKVGKHSVLDIRSSVLHTHAIFIGSVESISACLLAGPSNEEPFKIGSVGDANVRHYIGQILAKWAPVDAQRVEGQEDVGQDIFDAVARMIRDADKGYTIYGDQYDLDKDQITLRDLGRVEIETSAVLVKDWAYQYNAMRAQQDPGEQQSKSAASSPTPANLRNAGSGSWLSKRRGGRDRPKRNIPTYAFRTVERVLETILFDEGYRFQFASYTSPDRSDSTEPVVVPRNALWDDALFQVDRFRLPAVLRRDDLGQYKIIGEACFGKNSDGSWLSGSQVVRGIERPSELIAIQLKSDISGR